MLLRISAEAQDCTTPSDHVEAKLPVASAQPEPIALLYNPSLRRAAAKGEDENIVIRARHYTR